MFKAKTTIEDLGNLEELGHGVKIFPLAPVIDSDTRHRVRCENEDICPESSESLIYLMQNLCVGDSSCLTFFDSGANTHLIDGQLEREEELQLISSCGSAQLDDDLRNCLFFLSISQDEDEDEDMISASRSIRPCLGET